MNISKRINKILNEKSMTKAELQRKSGMSKTTLYDIVKGTKPNPTIDTLETISESLEVDIVELLKDKSEVEIFSHRIARDLEKLPDETRKKAKKPKLCL